MLKVPTLLRITRNIHDSLSEDEIIKLNSSYFKLEVYVSSKTVFKYKLKEQSFRKTKGVYFSIFNRNSNIKGYILSPGKIITFS